MGSINAHDLFSGLSCCLMSFRGGVKIGVPGPLNGCASHGLTKFTRCRHDDSGCALVSKGLELWLASYRFC